MDCTIIMHLAMAHRPQTNPVCTLL